MWNKPVVKFFLFFLSCCPLFAWAQPIEKVKDNSPYSRLGLGDLFSQNFAAIAGMGHLSAAFNDPAQLNLQNPASLGSLELTSFEVGMYSKGAFLEDGIRSLSVWSGDLAYLSLGFTTRNRINEILDKNRKKYSWGMNFSLLPYSKVNYAVEVNTTVNDTSEVTNLFAGDGGTYRFVWGNGVRFKNFSVGVNLGYLFGKLSNRRQVYLLDDFNSYYVETRKDIGVSGFNWNFGLQYDLTLKKTKSDGTKELKGEKITFGLYGNGATAFETNTSLLETRQSLQRFPSDTTTNTTDLLQNGKMPAEWSVGILYQKPNKRRFGVNYTFTGWSKYENEAKPESLDDAHFFSIGGEYIPDFTSYNNYLKKIRYRYGAYYGTDPRAEMTTYAITFGFGLPIILPRETISNINLGFEIGKLGPKEGLKENFFKVNLGLSLNDNSWFFKRRFG